MLGLHDNGWLDDLIIDYAMAHLKNQFPAITGLQSCLLASKLKFRRQDTSAGLLQIVNTEVDGPGMHWILASSIHCTPSDINVYDSVNLAYISEHVQAALAKLCHMPSKILSVRFKQADSQLSTLPTGSRLWMSITILLQ